MDHRREIDGLRTIAVLPVILSHAKFGLVPGGYLGVDIFFVISGFLITLMLVADMEAGRFSLLQFYERRARRILPALTLVVAVTSLVAWFWLLPDDLLKYSQSVMAVALFASNFFFWQTDNYFAPAADLAPMLHTWSLAVEEQFYLLFPLVLLVIWRLARRWVWQMMALMALVSLLLSQWASVHYASANFYLAPTRVWELLAGSLAAWLMLHRPPPVSDLAAGAGLVLILGAMVSYGSETPIPSLLALVPVGGAVLVLVFGRSGTLVARGLSVAPMVWIGLISYSAYLWHQPIFALARIKLLERPSGAVMILLVILSLLLAALSWRFVEQPFRGRAGQRRFSRSAVFGLSGASLVAMVGLGLAGSLSEGAEGRLNPEAIAKRAELAANFTAMQAAIRSGTCSFTERGPYQRLGPFLEHWDCRGQGGAGLGGAGLGGAGLRPTGIAIYGDSHAADIAGALWLNGLDALQLTGNGCSLAPSQMNQPCRQIAERFRTELARAGVTQVWLANRFSAAELATGTMAELAAYWTLPGVRVTIFTPLPEFPGFEPRMIRFAWRGEVPDLRPDLRTHDRFVQADLHQILSQSGIAVADSTALFCSGRPDCSPLAGDAMLMNDESHLSPAGAKLFGAGLLSLLPPPQ